MPEFLPSLLFANRDPRRLLDNPLAQQSLWKSQEKLYVIRRTYHRWYNWLVDTAYLRSHFPVRWWEGGHKHPQNSKNNLLSVTVDVSLWCVVHEMLVHLQRAIGLICLGYPSHQHAYLPWVQLAQTVARFHSRFGWPELLLGLHSFKWSNSLMWFDLLLNLCFFKYWIACPIKKLGSCSKPSNACSCEWSLLIKLGYILVLRLWSSLTLE